MSLIMPYMQGFATGAGLIIAIGAQNAFVLTHSIRKNHHLIICLVCAICDTVLITLGILGTGELVASNPMLLKPAAWGGTAFLTWYGFMAFKSAIKGGKLESTESTVTGVRPIILLTLAITLLNPHVYIDTVVMLGSISAQYSGDARYLFGFGAVSASFVWFFTLGIGGCALAPLFRKPNTWRILDTVIGLTMWLIAINLARKGMGV
ncbi:LysE/ArgO family amino acid transporter [Maridesulfovibrio hydrothermalis]|uniref:Arginine exporter protein ArgO n=1 Tax=Maridesulfovibrio hydrothermalis AM13 = DSM 14728 TaxID=1121451 RepID=L0RH90_9BACT|nr:LysE/ArgO family amino acid transporter [Maridesulfovibrio hydrothermalis]CCO24916.1 Arginine exporter protein ArgO [Maridesulfovibrio hydrothermalis AM13 = DSM 14728]